MVTFNFSFQPNVSEAHRSVFEMAGLVWSQFLADDIELNIHVATTDALPRNVLGGAVPGNYADQSYTSIQAALAEDVTSTADRQAVNNLNRRGRESFEALLENGTFTGDTVSLTRATAKALGLNDSSDPTQLDGYIVLNNLEGSNFQWDFDYARTGNALEDSVDALSVAMHEIGHVLGFTSGLDAVRTSSGQASDEENDARLSDTSVLDLFRYSDRSAPSGQLDLGVGAASYFSIDGGQTRLADFSTGLFDLGLGTNGYQASHWDTSRSSSSVGSFSQRTSGNEPSGTFLANSRFLGLTLFNRNDLSRQSSLGSSLDNALSSVRNSASSTTTSTSSLDDALASVRTSSSSTTSIASSGSDLDNALPSVRSSVSSTTSASGSGTVFTSVRTSTSSTTSSRSGPSSGDDLDNALTSVRTSTSSTTSSGSGVDDTLTPVRSSFSSNTSPSSRVSVSSNPSLPSRSTLGSDLSASLGSRTNSSFPRNNGVQSELSTTLEELTAEFSTSDRLSNALQVVTEREGQPIGVMGPTLVVEERSHISWIDLAAFDAIGYDLTPLGQLFIDAQVSSIDTLSDELVSGTPAPSNVRLFGIPLNFLRGSLPIQTQIGLAAVTQVTTNMASHRIVDGTDAIGAMIEQSELYERRKRKRRTRNLSNSFLQEVSGVSTSASSQSIIIPGTSETSDTAALSDRFKGLIRGQVRFDRDGDGDFQDRDAGLKDVTVQLFSDFDQDGQEDGVAIATTKTDEVGRYTFGALASGQYIAVAQDLAGFISTADVNGFNPNRINNIRVKGNTIRNQDFLDTAANTPSSQTPALRPPTISIGIKGQVRYDFDQDGDLRDSDRGIARVPVQLFADFDRDGQEDGRAIATTTTDSNGRYTFENLASGKYIVVAQDLDGLFSTADRNGFNLNRIANVTVKNRVVTNQDFLDSSALPLSKLTKAFGIRPGQKDFKGTAGNDEWGGYRTNDYLFGSAGDDKLYGGPGEDLVVGDDGDDRVVGGPGRDILQGNSGNDIVVGLAGQDILDGTDGQSLGKFERDSLVGGDGADQFILGTSDSPYYVAARRDDFARIKDFQPGIDKLVLNGIATDYSIEQRRQNTVIAYKQTSSSTDKADVIAYLNDLQPSDLDAASIQYV